MKLRSLIVVPLFFLLFSGCSRLRNDLIITSDEYGFDLSNHFETEERTYLDALISAGGDPQYRTETDLIESYPARHYTLQDKKKGILFSCDLLFGKTPSSKAYVYSGYSATVRFDHWPEGDEAAAIQAVFDHMIEQLGEYDISNSSSIIKDHQLFDKYKISKYAIWQEGDVRFYLDYDLVTKETKVIIHDDRSIYSHECRHQERRSPG